METNKKENPVNDSLLKQISKVLVPGDKVTISFTCPKFAYMELVVREIPTSNDSSISIKNG